MGEGWGEVEHPLPPPRSEAGAAPNQASLAAPSASEHRGQMEARPHMLPHIRWRLEEGGAGGGALATFWPCATYSQLRGAPEVQNPAPESSVTSNPPLAACVQGASDTNRFQHPTLLKRAASAATGADARSEHLQC